MPADTPCRECLVASCCDALEECLAAEVCGPAFESHERCFSDRHGDPEVCFETFYNEITSRGLLAPEIFDCIVFDCGGALCGAPKVIFD